MKDEHKKWNKKTQGLTIQAQALLMLAVTAATWGTGASLVGVAAGSVEGSMASAAFSTLVSQTSISLISNQGDLSKTFKDLKSSENIRSLLTSVLSAGITQGMGEHLGLPSQANSFIEHLQVNLARSGVSSGLSVSIQQQNIREALEQAARGAVAGTLGGWAANQIGEAY